jgi:hypothetical protein
MGARDPQRELTRSPTLRQDLLPKSRCEDESYTVQTSCTAPAPPIYAIDIISRFGSKGLQSPQVPNIARNELPTKPFRESPYLPEDLYR